MRRYFLLLEILVIFTLSSCSTAPDLELAHLNYRLAEFRQNQFQTHVESGLLDSRENQVIVEQILDSLNHWLYNVRSPKVYDLAFFITSDPEAECELCDLDKILVVIDINDESSEMRQKTKKYIDLVNQYETPQSRAY